MSRNLEAVLIPTDATPSTILGLDATGAPEALSAADARTRMGVDLLRWRGAWDVATAYVAGDGVTSGGSTWRALQAVTGGSAPSEGATWTVAAAKGATGDTGATGAQGPAGANGEGSWPAIFGTAIFMGGESATGWAAADYVTASAPAVVPALGPGQSLVVCLWPLATPTGPELIISHVGGGGVRGWYLGVGNNASARRQLRLWLCGLGGGTYGTEQALTGAELTVGVPCVIALAIDDDKSVRYSIDGGTVQTISALSGTFIPPTSADTLDLGSTRAFVGVPATYPLTSALIGEARTYSTKLNNSDLIAACANRTNGTIPSVATGTLSTRFLPSDLAGGTRVKAQTGVTWIAKGGASVRSMS